LSAQLPFDPIEEARRHWDQRWDRTAGGEMVAVTSIMRVHQILTGRLNELLEPFELTFPRYEALMLLHGLEHSGLVRRVPHESDRRAVLAEILPAGRTVAESATEALNEAGFATEPLSAPELSSVASVLRTLRLGAGDFPG